MSKRQSRRDWGISARAREQCRTLGVSPEEAQSYVRQAAPFTAPGFNRRYEGFVFRVERRTIEEIGLYEDHSPRARLKTEPLDPGAELLKRTFDLLERVLDSSVANMLTDRALEETETLVDDIERFLG